MVVYVLIMLKDYSALWKLESSQTNVTDELKYRVFSAVFGHHG